MSEREHVEVSYVVVQVSQIPMGPGEDHNVVRIILDKLYEEKGQIRVAMPSPVDLSMSEEERIGQKMVTAGVRAAMMQVSPKSHSVLELSHDEYESLGKPTLNDVLVVRLGKAGGVEGADDT